jgi:hypothetical protein
VGVGAHLSAPLQQPCPAAPQRVSQALMATAPLRNHVWSPEITVADPTFGAQKLGDSAGTFWDFGFLGRITVNGCFMPGRISLLK